MSILIKNYSQLLEQLLKTDCIYDDDNTSYSEEQLVNVVAARKEHMQQLIDNIPETVTNQMCDTYIDTFNRFVDIVVSSRSIEVSNDDFFKYFSKAIAKKNNKPAQTNGFFFLNNNSIDKLNIGKIIRKQIDDSMNTNVKKIKHYLYINYVECCNQIDNNIKNWIENKEIEVNNLDSSTKKNYRAIVKELYKTFKEDDEYISEEDEDEGVTDELQGQIKGLCSSMVDSLIPNNEMKDAFNTMMKNPQMDSVLSTLIKTTCSKDEINKLKRELNNNTEEDFKNMFNDTKKALDDMNLNLDNIDDPDSLEKLKDNLKKQLGGSLSDADVDKKMQSLMKNNDVQKLTNTAKEQLKDLQQSNKIEEIE